ncbi:MAG: type II secretion system protein [Acidobacteriota bacterium]
MLGILPSRGTKVRSGTRRNQRGLTLIELIVAFTILAILTTMSLPLTRYKVRRDKERDLRIALREIRTAIDKYKDAADKNLFQIKVGTEGYPETLEILVEGIAMSSSPDGTKIKFLRKIPTDPMTGMADWGLRAMKDDPGSQSWSGGNVFDVYTKSQDRAPDGTLYQEW